MRFVLGIEITHGQEERLAGLLPVQKFTGFGVHPIRSRVPEAAVMLRRGVIAQLIQAF